MLGDRSSRKVVATSYWASEGDMQASEDAVRESRESAGETIGASGGPEVEPYEVLLDIEN